jgi:NADH-quinone oxidoreductase subunit L
MVVGLVGAFLTAAYMTRATYLTFFGSPRGASAGEVAHDDHHAVDTAGVGHGHDGHTGHDTHAGPRESGPLITVPLVLLATLAIGSGFLNATPFGSSWERLKDWVEPRPAVVEVVAHGGPGESRAMASEDGYSDTPCGTEAPEKGVCYAPALEHAKFKWSKALLSLAIVFAGIAISWLLSVAVYTRKMRPFAGLTSRVAPLRWLHLLLVNKYFLDALYERVIVRAVAGPIARAAYWFNQRVIDGILHTVAAVARAVSGWLYRNVDQRVVDGTVNASGRATRGAGGAMQPIQSGKVSQYGALLFAAAAVAALVLVIVNT